MVSIINYKSATNSAGEEFFLLQVMGGVESVISQETGRAYLTARKATVSTTFDEVTCQNLIGTKLPGGIEKVETEPYAYTIEATGEEIQLSHRYVYNPNLQSMEEAVNERAQNLALV
jgi:hypothetical protein